MSGGIESAWAIGKGVLAINRDVYANTRSAAAP